MFLICDNCFRSLCHYVPKNVEQDIKNAKMESPNAVSTEQNVQLELILTVQVIGENAQKYAILLNLKNKEFLLGLRLFVCFVSVLHNTPYNYTNCTETQWSPQVLHTNDGWWVHPIHTLGSYNNHGWDFSVCGAKSVLFALNYNTPVVKSAGGSICFSILACISLCSLSVFFHFGEPKTASWGFYCFCCCSLFVGPVFCALFSDCLHF